MVLTIDVTVENPAKKWPGVFSSVPLFVKYPYLLPCIVASAVTLTGKHIALSAVSVAYHPLQVRSCHCSLDPTVVREKAPSASRPRRFPVAAYHPFPKRRLPRLHQRKKSQRELYALWRGKSAESFPVLLELRVPSRSPSHLHLPCLFPCQLPLLARERFRVLAWPPAPLTATAVHIAIGPQALARYDQEWGGEARQLRGAGAETVSQAVTARFRRLSPPAPT